MNGMFLQATSFNQAVPFDTSKVTAMTAMFNGASSFDQAVLFDTSSVTSMYKMFGATSFDQVAPCHLSSVMDSHVGLTLLVSICVLRTCLRSTQTLLQTAVNFASSALCLRFLSAVPAPPRRWIAAVLKSAFALLLLRLLPPPLLPSPLLTWCCWNLCASFASFSSCCFSICAWSFVWFIICTRSHHSLCSCIYV